MPLCVDPGQKESKDLVFCQHIRGANESQKGLVLVYTVALKPLSDTLHYFPASWLSWTLGLDEELSPVT